MGSIGMPEIIVIFLVILIFFGAKRLPELAKGLGKGIREFKDAMNNVQQEMQIEEPKNGNSKPRNIIAESQPEKKEIQE